MARTTIISNQEQKNFKHSAASHHQEEHLLREESSRKCSIDHWSTTEKHHPSRTNSKNITAGSLSNIDRRRRSITLRAAARTNSNNITAGSSSSNQDKKRRTFRYWHVEPEGETCPSEDNILDYAIEYKLSGTYPPKEKKRAVRKRAIVDNGEIYVQRKKGRVKVVTSTEEQGRILRACHSDATSGYFGSTKTWRRVAERFYWRGMANQVKEMVRF